MTENFRSGFVALIGRPNVGKSTLMNKILGEKVAITSNKPQTTRNRIQGIHTDEQKQIIFLDTPGIHKPKHKLGEYMVHVAMNTMNQVDVILYLIDITQGFGAGEEYIINSFKKTNTPVILVLNKIDLLPKEEILGIIAQYQDKYSFKEIIPVSAFKGENVDRLLHYLSNYLPEGPMFYPEDMLTDQPEKQIMAEIIREKILRSTEQEIPHATQVQIESLEYRSSEQIYLHAIIYVERTSQKAIIIGKNGQMLKKIGQLARQEIEGLFGVKAYLELWVKVKPEWRRHEISLKNFGYDKKNI
jgi:GTP-binding protein Era